MNKAVIHPFQKLLLAGVASATLGIGASTAASASTGTTEPADEMTDHTEAEHTMGSAPASLAVDGSADASSPEAEAFCTATVALQAAADTEDQAAIGPALEAATAAAPADAAPLLESVVANIGDPESPEFAEAYGAMLDYMRANCGFAELGVVASEYAFGGVPAELPAGPIIVTFENTGEELHVFEVARINDDVTLSIDELLALPEEEVFTMITMVGGAFASPGSTGNALMDLTPGRYIAVCPIPQGFTPEVAAQFEETEGTEPAGAEPAGTEPAGTEPAGTEAAGTEPAGTEPTGSATAGSATAGSAPAGSAPAGSAPGGPELGPPHFVLGMIQEFTVV